MSTDPEVDFPTREPCPPPLAWQEVAQSFHESAQSRIVETPGCELKVVEFGTGRPVVFLPPPCGSVRLYCLTAWLLKEDYRSILFEIPRFTVPPRPAQYLPAVAEVFSLAVEHFVPGGADLFASSISSQIALQMMLARPHLVRSAYLQGGWGHRRYTLVERLMLQAGCRLPLALRHVPFWQSAQIENHRHWFPPFDETRFGFLVQEAGITRACDYARQMLAAAATDLRPRLSQIRSPVAVLHCEGEGRQIAETERELERLIPQVHIEEMPHSGLFPYLTHPQRLVKLLKSFWQSVANGEVMASTAGSGVSAEGAES